jgi:ubiquinone/menaquinone biosynthesis C-methylase UbiE
MRVLPYDTPAENSESVFERCSWFYALCRERLFADHTEKIVEAMAPVLGRQATPLLFEVGCGPGFYSCRLAGRFPDVDVVGMDPSRRLLARAKNRARREMLENCRFVRACADQLADSPEVADFIIASRLFLILANRRSALEAIYIALRPSGFLFIAEPLSHLRAALPLTCMRVLQLLAGAGNPPVEFTQCTVLDKSQFADFVASQPWRKVRHWSDQRYQYALCEKPA